VSAIDSIGSDISRAADARSAIRMDILHIRDEWTARLTSLLGSPTQSVHFIEPNDSSTQVHLRVDALARFRGHGFMHHSLVQRLTMRLLGGAGILCLSTAAWAQAEPPKQSLAGGAEEIEVIIVTAQRREERAVDVPISLSTVDESALATAGVLDLRSLPTVVPGLVADQTGVIFQPAIRGVSSATTGFGFEASTAIYVDGVYYPSTNSNMQDFPDVSRIEVLRGPQGTLFGRNAVGGAIRIMTRNPSLDEVEGTVEVGGGSFGAFNANGFVSVPVSSTLAVSLAGSHEENHGYNHDIFRDRREGNVKSDFVRGKIRFAPEWGDFIVSGFYRDRTDVQPFAQAPINGNTRGRRVNPTVLLPTDEYDIAHDADDDLNVRSYGFTLQGIFDVGFAELTSTTAYLNSLTSIRNDSDASPTPVQSFIYGQRDDSFSQEINFSSKSSGPVTWVAGAYYFDAESDWEDPLTLLFNNVPAASIYNRIETKAYAVYGQADVGFLDRFTLTLGMRYSYEEKALFGSFNSPVVNDFGDADWNSLTPRVALRYQIAPNTNVYGSYSKGFKSGGFNTTGVASPAVDPEKVDAFEVGLKTALGRLALDTSVFYYEISDLQVGVLRVLNTTENAATARSYGIDIEPVFNVTDDLRISGSLSYLNSKYDDYPNASILVPSGLGGNVAASIDASDNYTIRSPKWTTGAAVSYQKDIAMGRLLFDGNVYYNDGFFFEAGNRVKQPSYTLLNFELGWEPKDNLKVSAWVRNVLDEQYAIANVVSTNVDSIALAPPRSYGGAIRVKF
jgi:iron complex outermembrane recepter protein